jgi:adenylosuccinate synthase
MIQIKQATIIVDLGYGDSGKGTIVDYLTNKNPYNSLVIRYNGGPQAAHNVVTPDEKHHTFSNYGSGTLHKYIRTFLSKYVLVDPFEIENERVHLEYDFNIKNLKEKIIIDEDCLLISCYHVLANQAIENNRKNRHGSCGMGIGETMEFSLLYPDKALHVKDIPDTNLLYEKLKFYRDWKLEKLNKIMKLEEPNYTFFRTEKTLTNIIKAYQEWYDYSNIQNSSYLKKISDEYDNLIFEGAQGILLDEEWGFYPYNTWSKTTSQNALNILEELEVDKKNIKTIGVMRPYMTRHGAGPLVTEDSTLNSMLTEKHNKYNMYQFEFRHGWLDLNALNYSLFANGKVNNIAITNMDQILPFENIKVCDYQSYELPFVKPIEKDETLTNNLFKIKPEYIEHKMNEEWLIDKIQDSLNTPISILSYSPTFNGKKEI